MIAAYRRPGSDPVNAPALGQLSPPTIQSSRPVAASPGKTVALEVKGADLDGATSLSFDVPGVKVDALEPSKTALKAKVTIPADAPPARSGSGWSGRRGTRTRGRCSSAGAWRRSPRPSRTTGSASRRRSPDAGDRGKDRAGQRCGRVRDRDEGGGNARRRGDRRAGRVGARRPGHGLRARRPRDRRGRRHVRQGRGRRRSRRRSRAGTSSRSRTPTARTATARSNRRRRGRTAWRWAGSRW